MNLHRDRRASIIVPGGTSFPFTRLCLQILFRHTSPAFEPIVVDAAVVPRTLFAAILIRINLLWPVPRTHGETYRAALGGPLTSRELWVRRSCSSRCLPLPWGMVTRVRGRIHFGAPARGEAWPERLRPCHWRLARRVFPVWY